LICGTGAGYSFTSFFQLFGWDSPFLPPGSELYRIAQQLYHMARIVSTVNFGCIRFRGTGLWYRGMDRDGLIWSQRPNQAPVAPLEWPAVALGVNMTARKGQIGVVDGLPVPL
jgi:hypothetical protein